MVKGIFNRFRKMKDDKADISPITNITPNEDSTSGPISELLSSSGRIALATLCKISQKHGKKEFVKLIKNPVLVGSAINDTTGGSSGKSDSDLGGQTQLLKTNTSLEKRSGPGASLPYAIYPLIKTANAKSPIDTFKIGRTKINDMIMKDMAISKEHAAIRASQGSYFIEDCGSTNGTRINGKRIRSTSVEVHDKDVIGFGYYEFSFLFPSSLYDLLQKY